MTELNIKLPEAWKRMAQRYKYIMVAIIAGIILLMLPTQNAKPTEQGVPVQQTFDDEVKSREAQLEAILSQIQNAGKVHVMLSIRDGRRTVVAYDTKTSGDQSQYDTVIVSRGSGIQQPVVLQEIGPTYQGALVVCTGGDDPQVKLQVTNAVRSLTGLSADRICICKSK